MIISHNLLAMNADRMFGINNKSKAKSAEKLSSGYRINRAADDAAGLAISEKMRRQIRGLAQGVRNTEEGIGFCQVADGALNEVNDMLHRITELSVKAANGTNSEEDRQYIQQEVSALLAEIDRIGDTTVFNEIPVFCGEEEILRNADGTPFIESLIPFSDFTIADVDLGLSPFNASSTANRLSLQAVVNNEDSVAHGVQYRLIFGDGSTSKPSVRISYQDLSGAAKQDVFDLNSSVRPVAYRADAANRTWERDFRYANDDGISILITQRVVANDGADAKDYRISYEFTNESANNTQIDMDFMFHADTAYNNNDRCEGYFTDGNRIDKFCIYNEDDHFTGAAVNDNIHGGIPSSFSIVDVDQALAFSEKITIDQGNKPNSLSIGIYSSIDEWSYYNSLNGHLGRDAIGRDLGFSLMWNYQLGGATGVDSVSAAFNYGIAPTESDDNLAGVDIKKSLAPATIHKGSNPVFIHSGCEPGDGIWLKVREMNTNVLGIGGLDVSTQDGAGNAIESVKKALKDISFNRSEIGAQQNRLEHTIANEDNIVENTTAAESRIRDTDMAGEMVRFSNLDILGQAGQAMLAQANQSSRMALSLLQ